eukprot:1137446-Pelagomonas_calceolata.AAC.1
MLKLQGTPAAKGRQVAAAAACHSIWIYVLGHPQEQFLLWVVWVDVAAEGANRPLGEGLAVFLLDTSSSMVVLEDCTSTLTSAIAMSTHTDIRGQCFQYT